MPYEGPERRNGEVNFETLLSSMKDDIRLLLAQQEKFLGQKIEMIQTTFGTRMDSFEVRLDKIEDDLGTRIEKVAASFDLSSKKYVMDVESKITRLENKVLEVEQDNLKLRQELEEIKNAPIKKDAKDKSQFVETGKKVLYGAFWVFVVGFIGYELLKYAKVLP